VAQAFGLPVRTEAALDEIDFGEWAGRTFAELNADPRWTEWNGSRSEARCPSGETMGEAQARALAFAFEAAAAPGRALLVTHCDIIRALHCWAERVSLDRIHDIDCPPGHLSRLDLAAMTEVAA
jgi:broad specificity phosphatase PhoE